MYAREMILIRGSCTEEMCQEDTTSTLLLLVGKLEFKLSEYLKKNKFL